jgi:hypothetical protein
MPRRNSSKRRKAKAILRLPDLEQSTTGPSNDDSFSSASLFASQRSGWTNAGNRAGT